MPTPSDTKIIHVANVIETTSPRLQQAQQLFLQSINENLNPSVTLLNVASRPLITPELIQTIPTRDAKIIDPSKDYPFLKDLLDHAATQASDSDWLFYCNSDCILGIDFYADLINSSSEFIQYHRLDCPEFQNLNEIYRGPTKVNTLGIDGFAIRKSLYLKIRDSLPDFLIGNPGWDPCLNNLCAKYTAPLSNYISLYHREHARTWDLDNPTPTNKYNLDLIKQYESTTSTKINYDIFVKGRQDTAIVAFSLEEDDSLTIKNFEALYQYQVINASYYLVTFSNNPRMYDSLKSTPKCKLVVLDRKHYHLLTDPTLYLCNYGADLATESHLIFLNLNCYSNQQHYLQTLRTKIINNLTSLIIGYDSVHSRVSKPGWATLHLANRPKNLNERAHAATDFVVGCSRALYESFDKFNKTQPFVDPLLLTLTEFTDAKDILETFVVVDRQKIRPKPIKIAYIPLPLFAYNDQSEVRQKLNYVAQTIGANPYSLPVKDWNSETNPALGVLSKTFIRNKLTTHFLPSAWDFAVIIPTYGKQHSDLVVKTVAALQNQHLKAYIIIVELLFDSEKSSFSFTEPDIIHRIVRGNANNKLLFQKEALINIGAEHLPPSVQYILFMDGDVYTTDAQWLKKVRHKLIETNKQSDMPVAIQPFIVVMDEIDPAYHMLSFAAAKQKQMETGAMNPGIAWAVTRKYFNDIGGLNPFFIYSGGDLGFCAELFNTDQVQFEHYISTFPVYKEILRKVPNARFNFIDSRLIHLHHGFLAERAYTSRFKTVAAWDKPIKEVVTLDTNKLLAWLPNTEAYQKSFLIPLEPDIAPFTTPITPKTTQQYSLQILRNHTLPNDPYSHSCNCNTTDPIKTRLPTTPQFKPRIVPINHNQPVRASFVVSDLWQPITIPFPISKVLIITLTPSSEVQVYLHFESRTIHSNKATLTLKEKQTLTIPLQQFLSPEFDFSSVLQVTVSIPKPCDELVIDHLEIK